MWEGCLDKLFQHLLMTNSTIVKETLWAFSNITAGVQSHVQLLLNHPSFDRILVLSKNPNIDIRQEALWVLCNAITGADLELRQTILYKGGDELISSLVAALYIQDLRLLTNVLESIKDLLDLDGYC